MRGTDLHGDGTERSRHYVLELASIILLLGVWGLALFWLAGLPDVAKLPRWAGWGELDLLIRSPSGSMVGVWQLAIAALWALWAALVVWLTLSVLAETALIATAARG